MLWNNFTSSLPLLLSLLGFTSQVSGQGVVTVVHTFPLGTWIENLAVRKNGLILATPASSPQLYQVDPEDEAVADLVSTIPGHLSLSGITEVEPDVFYIGANNFSVSPPSAQPNTSAVYRVDVANYAPGKPLDPKLIAEFPDSILLNGFTTLDRGQKLILIADAGKGWVWRLNVETGEKTVVVSDRLMTITNPAKEPIGVNGLKIHDGYLYWLNTNQEILAKIPITKDAVPTGVASVVTNWTAPDDFLFVGKASKTPESVLVAGDDTIRLFDGSALQTLSDSPLLKGSTAVAKQKHSRARGQFFVSSNGGVAQYASGNITVPGRILSFSLQAAP